MPTLDHRVGVINSPRTSHSLLAVGMDAVAEAALPVALRVSGVSAIVAESLNSFQSDGEMWEVDANAFATNVIERVCHAARDERVENRQIRRDWRECPYRIRKKYKRSSSLSVTSLDSILNPGLFISPFR